MGRVSGYQCDGPDCKELNLENGAQHPPKGWLSLTVSRGDFGPETFQLHSNKCTKKLVDARVKAEKEIGTL